MKKIDFCLNFIFYIELRQTRVRPPVLECIYVYYLCSFSHSLATVCLRACNQLDRNNNTPHTQNLHDAFVFLNASSIGWKKRRRHHAGSLHSSHILSGTFGGALWSLWYCSNLFSSLVITLSRVFGIKHVFLQAKVDQSIEKQKTKNR